MDKEPKIRKVKYTRSKRACTTCRQIKLKCDAIDKFPKKCTRCERLGSICEIDTNFKREPVRRNSNSHTKVDTVSREDSIGSSLESNLSTLLTPNSTRTVDVFPYIDDVGDELVDSLIPKDKIILMFKTFYQVNYCHLPILSKQLLDPRYLWMKNYKLLFFAICNSTSVLCCPELELVLQDKIKELAYQNDSTYMVDPLHSLSVVFASLILCYWPLRSSSIQNDESIVHVGRAVDIGMKIGLHRFAYTREYCITLDDALKEQIQTATVAWAGCFITKTVLCSIFGMPSSLPLNYNIFTTFKNLPQNNYIEDFGKQLKLAQFIQTSMNSLGNNSETEFGMVDPAIRGIQHKAITENLSIIIAELTPCSKVTESLSLLAKLLVHSFLLVPDTLPEDQDSAAMSLYLVCVKLIEILLELVKENTNFPTFILSYSAMAATILYGLSISKRYRELINKSIARNSLSDFYELMQKLQRYPNDYPTRIVRVMDGLKSLDGKKLIREPIFTVRTRMGASAFWSLLLPFKRAQIEEQQKNKDSTVEPLEQADVLDAFMNDMFNQLWDGDLSNQIENSFFH
ncbi:uncharacterized protein RJT21DRAFT_29124 [Scheffersomyces amazonensis]|uniref:uncharacterized protein n=1 Tax=Scheffersomyces amazonensis TaxID=1078765 RepID=UPI00315DD8F4